MPSAWMRWPRRREASTRLARYDVAGSALDEVGPAQLSLEEGDLLARALDLPAEPCPLRAEVDHALEVDVHIDARGDHVGGLGRTRRLRAHGDSSTRERGDEGATRLERLSRLGGGTHRDLDLGGGRHPALAPSRPDRADHADDG